MSNNLQKKTLNLRNGDWDYLEMMYQGQGIGPSIVIRTLIAKFVDQAKAQTQQNENLDVKVDL